MKGEKPKTSESCPRKNSSESERYEGAPTLIGIVGAELVEVQLSSDRMLEYMLTPDNLNRAYKQVKANGAPSIAPYLHVLYPMRT